jgi:8-oxo-dGTP diphosphatase
LSLVHGAVGVVRDSAGRVLISRRRADAHQGGLWEFPGGKVEDGETVPQALARELEEELGIRIGPGEALLAINHDYGDKQVLLDVWLVDEFSGSAQGREGQPLVWAALRELEQYAFPAANTPIIAALIERA